MRHLRANWKKYAAVAIGAGVTGGAMYYGVDPALAKQFSDGVLAALFGAS
jgi:hypothetical protein